MRDLIHRSDVESILNQYKQELESLAKSFPKDLAIHYRMSAVKDIELRLRLLCRGGLKIIEGGKK